MARNGAVFGSQSRWRTRAVALGGTLFAGEDDERISAPRVEGREEPGHLPVELDSDAGRWSSVGILIFRKNLDIPSRPAVAVVF